MKKLFLTLAVVFGMVAAANAQLVVGGGIGFGVNTYNGTVKSGDLGVTAKDRVDFTFGFVPRVGYIINEKWEVGGKLSLDYNQTMNYDILTNASGKDGKAFKDFKDSQFTWAIQPYARFRCFEVKGFALWIEGVGSIGTSILSKRHYYAYEYDATIVGRTQAAADALNEALPKRSSFNGSLAFQPVLTYSLNEHWVLETSLNFLGFNLGGEVITTETAAGKSTRNTFDFGLNVNSDNIATLGFLQIGAYYKF